MNPSVLSAASVLRDLLLGETLIAELRWIQGHIITTCFGPIYSLLHRSFYSLYQGYIYQSFQIARFPLINGTAMQATQLKTSDSESEPCMSVRLSVCDLSLTAFLPKATARRAFNMRPILPSHNQRYGRPLSR